MSQDNNNPEDMTGMFCSVWVKVEAAEPDNHDGDYDPSLDSHAYTPESTQTSSTPVINVKPEEIPSSEILECKMSQDNNNPEDMTDMFCSVWVKEETAEPDNHDEDYDPSLDSYAYTPECTQTSSTPVINPKPEEIPSSEILECNNCEYKTTIKRNLSIHMRIHMAPLRCELCDFTFIYKRGLKKHLNEAHNQGFEEVKSFLHQSQLNCDWCNFTSKNEIKMVEHIKSNVRDEIIQCNHCEFNTFYACELEMHEKNDHVNNIGNHIDSETPDTAITTSINSTINEQQLSEPSSSQAQNFVSYNAIMYGKENCSSQNYLIDKTSVSFKSMLVLKTNDSEKPFQCPFCGYQSKFKVHVQKHFQRHHTSNDTKSYECINCDFSTKYKVQINLHNKSSESNTTIKCSQCDFTSLHKCSLKMHEKIHFKFKCESCTYSGRDKYLLTKHKLKHIKRINTIFK